MSLTATVIDDVDCGHGWRRIRIQIHHLITQPQPGQSINLGDRCLPIMFSDHRGSVECLVTSDQWPETTSVIKIFGIDGTPLRVDPRFRYPLLIGQDSGIAAMIFFSATMKHQADLRPLVLLGSHHGFPFRPQPSQILVPGLTPGIVAAAPLLEDWKIASRLASKVELPGCHDGTAVELSAQWLNNLDPEERKHVTLYVSGDNDTCLAAEHLATQYRLAIQSVTAV